MKIACVHGVGPACVNRSSKRASTLLSACWEILEYAITNALMVNHICRAHTEDDAPKNLVENVDEPDRTAQKTIVTRKAIDHAKTLISAVRK